MDPSDDGPSIPEELRDRFLPAGVLRRSPTGVVLRVRDRELGRDAALKVLPLEGRGRERRRLEREARALASLDHPHVVRIFDFGRTRDGLYLVTEALATVPLRPGAGEDPLEAMLAAARGIQATHEAGLLLRVLGPGGLGRDARGTVKLQEFGLAVPEDPELLARTALDLGGTGLLAPEVLRGERPTSASDWYTWGAVLALWYRGAPPQDAATALRIAGGEEPPPPPLDPLPPIARSLARACLHPDPLRRPVNAAALHRRAARIREGRAGLGGGLGRGLRLLSGAAALGALGVLALALRQGPPEDPGLPPVPPAPPPPRPAPRPRPAGPLPADLAHQVRAELSEASALVVDGSGRVRSPGPAGIGAGERQLLHPDPLHWGAVLDHLEAPALVQRWLEGGGRPEALPAGLRDQLAEADAAFARHGLPRPFHPFLAATPPPSPVPAPPRLGSTEFHLHLGVPRTLEGWPAAVAAAYQAMRDHQARLRMDARRAMLGGPNPHDLPRGPGGHHLGIALGFPDYVGGAYAMAHNRARVTGWLEPMVQEQRTLVYALSRSLRADREREDQHLAVGLAMLDDADVAWFQHHAFAPPRTWTGWAPETPADWALHAEVATRCAHVRRVAGAEREALLAEAADAWRRALGTLGPRVPFGDHRTAYAFRSLVENLLSRGRAQEAHDLFRLRRDELALIDEAHLGPALVSLARAWLEVPLAPGPGVDDMLAVVEWLDAHPEAFPEPRDQAEVRELGEVLLLQVESSWE